MTPPLATDWAQLLLAPLWSAFVALLLLALAVAFRRPLGQMLGKLGVSRVNLFGIDIEWIADQTADAYRERELPVPGDQHLRGISILAARLAPLVRDRRILWVDDHPLGNATEAGILQRLGVRVDSAVNSEQALEKATTSAAPYDLVISDWSRDDGDGAPVLAARFRAEDLDLPIIVYAGLNDGDRSRQAAESGISAITTVPEELLKHVLIELAST